MGQELHGTERVARDCCERKPSLPRIAIFAFFFLLMTASYSFAADTVCGTDKFDSVLFLSAIAALSTGSLIVLCYMFGEFFQNPRMLTWAKTEALQVFTSLVIVIVILGLLNSFCTLKIGDVGKVFTQLPAIYSGYEDKPLFDAADIYLENLMAISHSNLVSLRYSLGAYELRTTWTFMECDKGCWLSMVGYNIAQYSGESMQLAITNNMLGTATVAYLSAMFQYFTLQYIRNGLFLVFLPIAIIMRSLPFMRHFGGTLVAIFLSLYIMYPVMLVVDSSFAAGMTQTPINIYRAECIDPANCKPNPCGWLFGSTLLQAYCPGKDLFKVAGGPDGVTCNMRDANGLCYYEEDMGLSLFQVLGTTHLPEPAPLQEQARASALIFLVAVFLPALNFLIIAAMAKSLSHIIGDDVDISKLGQMV